MGNTTFPIIDDIRLEDKEYHINENYFLNIFLRAPGI
jgi:hypothetical protein